MKKAYDKDSSCAIAALETKTLKHIGTVPAVRTTECVLSGRLS